MGSIRVCAKIHRLSGLERVKQRQRYLDRTWQRHRETGRREAQRETQIRRIPVCRGLPSITLVGEPLPALAL